MANGWNAELAAELPFAEDNVDFTSTCTALSNFKSVMRDICKRYAPLNPKGRLFEYVRNKKYPERIILDETGMEFVRGGIIATVAAWECYIVDLFKEAFKVLIKIGYGEPASIDNLKRAWPDCEATIEKWEKIKKQKNTEEDPLMLYAEHILKTTITPIFLGRVPGHNEHFMCIDTVFIKLFGAHCSLSDLITKTDNFNYWLQLPGRYVRVDLFQIDNDESVVKALHNISRLYYGLRCTLVHGKAEQSLERCLRDFPVSAKQFFLIKECNDTKEEIAVYYIRLYEWIKKYHRELWVNYLDLVSITRFYKATAHNLMLAVKKFLYDHFTSKVTDEEFWNRR